MFGQLFFFMKRIALHNLGCKLNFTEMAMIGNEFIDHNYSIVDIKDQPDVVIINTCSVTSHADRECRQIIRKVLRSAPKAFIAVIGCYSQLSVEEVAAIEGVDLVLGTSEKKEVFNLIDGQQKKERSEIHVSCMNDQKSFYNASSVGFKDRTRAFIKIQDGCDYHCSYCTIPLARGKSRSAAIHEVLQEAHQAVDQEYKEIVLTGVNVGDYKNNDESSLVGLLRSLVRIDGIERIRISSVEPNLLTDELLDLWFSNSKICNHWHIPLQSGSNAVLHQMRRRYQSQVFIDRVQYIVSQVPKAGIGADVIVGFPTENEIQFQDTYSLLESLPVTYLHVFAYSERPDTHAMTLNPKVETEIKSMRSNKLRELADRKRKTFYNSFIGQTVPVLVETRNSDDNAVGLTEEYVRVVFGTKMNLTNQIVYVTINEVKGNTCMGTIVNEHNLLSGRIAI